MVSRTGIALLLVCMTVNGHVEGGPLFGSDQILDIVLEVPIKELLRGARKKPVVKGQLRYVGPDGGGVSIDIEMTTRGKSRLEYCSFPPLSITLNRGQSGSTLFAGQQKLKIVTHCRSGSTHLRYLLQEHGIYKAYNVLSDHSFRVRMLNVTYRDSQKKRREELHPAFFIESDDEVAERLGMQKIKAKTIESHQFDVAQTNIYELFQYMIANTDWAIRKGPDSEDCCHNGKVIAKPDAEDNWVVLPYDFDQAGVINTKYALPAIGLDISKVRQRLYRGRCRHNDQLNETISLFNDRREEIESAIAPQYLSDSQRKSILRYVAAYYAIINEPEELNQEIIEDCRGG
jgi:hypothetical protein